MEEPEKESVEQPTRTEQDAREADAFMIKEWAGIALVSIAALLLFALFLLASSGLAPFLGEEPSLRWLVFVVLGALVLAGFAWSRRGL